MPFYFTIQDDVASIDRGILYRWFYYILNISCAFLGVLFKSFGELISWFESLFINIYYLELLLEDFKCYLCVFCISLEYLNY